jgi:hypothetical protein
MRLVSSHLPRAAAALCALAIAGCASTDYHYSQLVGERYHRTPIDTYPVAIVRVDGKDTLMRPVLIEPGVHRVTVQGPPGAVSRLGEEREISLDIRPCTRYYLVAVRPNRLASDFTVQVDYEEPVGGCTPPTSS